MTSTATLDAAAVLASVRRERADADAAEARLLARVLEWAHLHQVASLDEGGVATWGDSPVPIAGDGAPLVSEFCIYELAPALGLSAEGGRYLLAHALELHHRLPRLWARVQGGTLQAWRARRVADKTITLSMEAAGFVDQQVAGFAHRISNTALDRLVDEAIARHMPETAQEMAQRAADGRFVRIDHQQVSFTGTSLIQGELDLMDALDLEKALQAGAEQLKALGSEEPLDVRRALSLGQLARGDQALGFETRPDGAPQPPSRTIVLHLTAAGGRGCSSRSDPRPHQPGDRRRAQSARMLRRSRSPPSPPVTVTLPAGQRHHRRCDIGIDRWTRGSWAMSPQTATTTTNPPRDTHTERAAQPREHHDPTRHLPLALPTGPAISARRNRHPRPHTPTRRPTRQLTLPTAKRIRYCSVPFPTPRGPAIMPRKCVIDTPVPPGAE